MTKPKTNKRSATAAKAGSKRLVPQFLTKTYVMVSDNGTNKIVTWTREGKSFVVLDPVVFAKEVLPRYFKHNNFSSFVRQLNMYGFTKSGEVNWWEFQHPHFVCGRKDHLKYIKRKLSMASGQVQTAAIESFKSDKSKLESELVTLKDTQVQLNEQVYQVQNANDSLWNEVQESKKMLSQMRTSVSHIFSFVSKMYADKKRPLSLEYQVGNDEVQPSAKRARHNRRLGDDEGSDDEGSASSAGHNLEQATLSMAQAQSPQAKLALSLPPQLETLTGDSLFPTYAPSTPGHLDTIPIRTPGLSIQMSADAKVKDPALKDMTLLSELEEEVWSTVPDVTSDNQTCPSF